MAYTNVEDVQVRLMRDLTAAEAVAAAVWIEDLEAEIEHRVVGGIAAALLAGTFVEATLRRVVAQAVIRVVRNPDGLRTYSRAVDDATFSGTIDSELSSGSLYLTDAEWELLLPASSESVFTITPWGAP